MLQQGQWSKGVLPRRELEGNLAGWVEISGKGYFVCVWIPRPRLRFAFHAFSLSFFFFFFLFSPQLLTSQLWTVHCLRVPQITFFSNFFIKNEFHNTIYTFKNYFATVFSVSEKISCIQTNPKYENEPKPVLPKLKYWTKTILKECNANRQLMISPTNPTKCYNCLKKSTEGT